jgi:multicomponent Na+:H+ antiporter subunit C
MTPFVVYALAGVAIFALGLFAVVARPHLLRKLLGLNVMGSAVFLILVAVAHRNREPIADPVPHAMVLTGIVVAVSVTGFALLLMRRIHSATGSVVLTDDEEES